MENMKGLCMGDKTMLYFPMDETIKNNEIQSRTLASIRDALLPKLLSGEIRVKEAEKFVEENK